MSLEESRLIIAGMDNKQIARILRETAQLLEIDGAIIGRYRSYEKAAELIDGLPESIEQLVTQPEKLEELPGIGERMVEHLQEIVKTGDYALRKKLLKKYPATILDLLQLQSLGAEEGGVSVVELQGGDGCGCGEDREGRKAAGSAGIWGKERTEHFESDRSVQEVDREIPHQYGGRGGYGDHRAHHEGGKGGGKRDSGGVAAARQGDGGRFGFVADAWRGAYIAKARGRAGEAHSRISGD